MIRRSVAQMISEARRQIENLTPAEVAAEVANAQTLLLDIREAGEVLQRGMIPGAVAAPRGLLEFYADRSSRYYREEFLPGRRMILYCASGERSALAAAVLQEIGYTNVAHLDGGLEAWQAADRPVVPALRWFKPLPSADS